MSEKFLKTGDVAKYFGVSLRTIKNWRQNGKLIPVSSNEQGHYLYSYSQLEEYKRLNPNIKDLSDKDEKNISPQKTKSNIKIITVDNSSDKKFGNILQGKPTNALTSSSGKNVTPNLLDNAEIFSNDVQIIIDQFSQVKLNVQTYKVFDACILKLTKNFPHGKNITDEALLRHKKVTISTNEYMEITGLKDRKQAYGQLKDAMNTLYRISFSWDEDNYTNRKKTIIHKEIRLAESMQSMSVIDLFNNIFERSSVTLNLSMDMARFFAHSYIMPYPYDLLTINSHKNPHSYFIGRRLALHYNMNISKKNYNRISVENLIKALPDLPKYEDVIQSSGKGVTQQIIQPFERDLIALTDIYKILKDWHYCNALGEPLTDEQVFKYNYFTWIEWYIEFEFNDYPDQTERILKSKLKKEK